MSISTFNHDEGIKQLAKLAYNKNLIPIFGSGFTKGFKSHNGEVPDGIKTIEIMKNLILKSTTDIKENDFEGFKFNEVAQLFYDYVPNDTIIEFFRNYFTGVTIDGYRKEFLEVIDWPYAYTLNIDDGIERTNSFKEVLPYKFLKRPRSSAKLLYKLHGDANTDVNYKEERNIVFSNEQYLKSITDEDNIDILNNLIGDFTQKNIIFIGCSLDDEIDLKYVYNRIDDKSDSNYKLLIRTSMPSILEEKRLRLYGINKIVVVEDFELFYRDFLIEYRNIFSEKTLDDYRYCNPNVVNCMSKEETINLLSGNSIFDERKNEFHKGGMHVLRNCVKEIEDKLEIHCCVVIKGRRFGGKSFVLCSLCERLKKYEIYYFPSTTTIDEATIDRMISEKSDSLFIFDSNSLSSSVYFLISNSFERLNGCNNKVVMVVNSNDNYISNSPNTGIIEINNTFEKKELNQNKIMSDKYGLIYRKYNNTNIDYLYLIKEEQKIDIKSIIKLPDKLRDNEQLMLLLLCAMDKVFYADLIALGIGFLEIKEFCERFKLIVEQVPTDKGESEMHSSTKIVHNSKIALLNILEQFSDTTVIKCIQRIVRKFRKDNYRKRIYIELILFDTLNQLFGGKKGAGHLIFKVYDALEESLNDSLHYWLQRAKSIYRILPKDEHQLKIAYSYAKKCYKNGYNGLRAKAALTTSLICCSLVAVNKDEQLQQLREEALTLAHEAIFSDYYRINENYLKIEFNNNSRNSYVMIKKICNSIIAECNDNVDMVQKSNDILEKINDIKISN